MCIVVTKCIREIVYCWRFVSSCQWASTVFARCVCAADQWCFTYAVQASIICATGRHLLFLVLYVNVQRVLHLLHCAYVTYCDLWICLSLMQKYKVAAWVFLEYMHTAKYKWQRQWMCFRNVTLPVGKLPLHSHANVFVLRRQTTVTPLQSFLQL